MRLARVRDWRVRDRDLWFGPILCLHLALGGAGRATEQHREYRIPLSTTLHPPARDLSAQVYIRRMTE